MRSSAKALVWCILSLLLVVSLAVPTAAQVTLRLFYITGTVPAADAVIKEAIQDFERSRPGVRIQLESVSWGEAHAQFLTSLVTGFAPDLAVLGGTWGAEFQRMGAFVSIEELGAGDLLNVFLPAAFSALKGADDRTYGVPWEGVTWGFFYRKDLFAQAGLDPNRPPQNWDELVSYGARLTTKDRYGLVFPAAGWEPDDYFMPFLWQAGNPIARIVDGKWRGALSEPSGVQAAQFYTDLVRKHKITPVEIVSMDWEAAKNSFVLGKAAMMYNGMWTVNVIRNSQPGLTGQWATAINPAGPAGTAALGYPNTLHITVQSKHKKEAMEFVKFFYSGKPSYADRFAMALGSLNWTKEFIAMPYAQDPLLKPFVDSMNISRNRPVAPKYEEFRSSVFNPGIQAMILGQVSPPEQMKAFDQAFNRLHS